MEEKQGRWWRVENAACRMYCGGFGLFCWHLAMGAGTWDRRVKKAISKGVRAVSCVYLLMACIHGVLPVRKAIQFKGNELCAHVPTLSFVPILCLTTPQGTCRKSHVNGKLKMKREETCVHY